MAKTRRRKNKWKTPKWVKTLSKKWKKTAPYRWYQNHETVLSVVVKPILVALALLLVLFGFYQTRSVSPTADASFVDVSSYQGTIHWHTAHKNGVESAIIRCGIRRSATGELDEDTQFDRNFRSAKLYGVKRGVYFYSQAVNEEEAKEEAEFVLQLLKDRSLDYPVYIDVEATGSENGRADGLTAEERTSVVKTFCEVIKGAGYEPGVYSNAWFLDHNLNMSELKGISVWVASYNGQNKPSYSGDYDLWQYTDSGKVDGIDTAVDLNIQK